MIKYYMQQKLSQTVFGHIVIFTDISHLKVALSSFFLICYRKIHSKFCKSRIKNALLKYFITNVGMYRADSHVS